MEITTNGFIYRHSLLLLTALIGTVFLFILQGTAVADPALEGDVYQLATSAYLKWFRDTVNSSDIESNNIKALLTADTNLASGGAPMHWTPIGGYFDGQDRPYQGPFDGGGYTHHRRLQRHQHRTGVSRFL